MSIQKQDFYEGSALHLLVRGGNVRRLIYKPPLFWANGVLPILLKYSTRNRTPWGFTFTPEEQRLLYELDCDDAVLGLICGSDGVAALRFREYAQLALRVSTAIHVSCARGHGRHYEVSGPNGVLTRKVAPAYRSRILDEKEDQ